MSCKVRNCITVNDNYPSSLNDNILDWLLLPRLVTTSCHSSSQQEMFLLLTESSVCDRYQPLTDNQRSDCLMPGVMISKLLPDPVLFSGSACLSATAAADFTTMITQKEFLHTEGLTSVCHLRQKLSFKQTNTFILSSTSAAWTWPGTLTCTLKGRFDILGTKLSWLWVYGPDSSLFNSKVGAGMTSYHVPVEQVGKPVPVRLAVVRITS